MSKNKKHNKNNPTPNRSDRYDWMKDSNGIPALQESSIELILKPKQKVEIPLVEYRALVENAFAVKVFKKFLGKSHYSHEVEDFAKVLFGEEEPKSETPKEDPKKEDEQNDG